jgi:hypothetical protein
MTAPSMATMLLFVMGAVCNGWEVRMSQGSETVIGDGTSSGHVRLAFSKPASVAAGMSVEQFVDQNCQLLWKRQVSTA